MSPASVFSADPTRGRSHTGDESSKTGTLIHLLVAQLAGMYPGLTPEGAGPAAKRLLSRWQSGSAPVYRQAVRMRAVTATAVYFTEFARPRWKLAAALTVVDTAEIDLLWRRGNTLVVDELKTGAMSETKLRRAHAQAQRQAEACRAKFGTAFAGVRVVTLREPSLSIWVSA